MFYAILLLMKRQERNKWEWINTHANETEETLRGIGGIIKRKVGCLESQRPCNRGRLKRPADSGMIRAF